MLTPILPNQTGAKSVSLYIHWPFCKSKCPYCNFNSHTYSMSDIELFESAYYKEVISFDHILSGRTIGSIFFGGGTPTLARPRFIGELLSFINDRYTLDDNVEITMEANPTSVEMKKFEELRRGGVNRISIGVQSFRGDSLRFLGREHSASEAKDAIDAARKCFDNYSFDLIYALPDQSIDGWRKELEEAAPFIQDHVSLYQLTIEKGTKFYKMHLDQDFVMPKEDLLADFYLATEEIMNGIGLMGYEISNYARNGMECRHNLSYWDYHDYVGIGPGAHGRISDDKGKHATMMYHDPRKWMNQVLTSENNNGLQSSVLLSGEERWEESVLMGLRNRKYGMKESILCRSDSQRSVVQDFIKLGLLEEIEYKGARHIRATLNGALVLNTISGEIINS